MDLALIVAIVAVLVALGAALYERRDRRAELAILRAQFEAQGKAQMYADHAKTSWEPVVYTFRIGNAGPAVARGIRYWLRAGNSSAAGDPLEPMEPGDWRYVTIELGRPLSHTVGTQTKARLECRWTDDHGEHEETLIDDLPSGP